MPSRVPLDDVPTGDAGHPADSIIQWDLADGKKIRDYNISIKEYLANTYEANCSRTDVDPGWSDPDCISEVRPANCPEDKVWGNFMDQVPNDCELSIFSYRDVIEALGDELPHPSTLGNEHMRVCRWVSRLLRHSGNKKRHYSRPYTTTRISETQSRRPGQRQLA